MVCYSTLYKIINAKVLGIYSIEWCPRVIVGAQRTNQDFISRRTQVLEYRRIDPRLPTRFFTNFSTASSQKWITNCSLHGSQCSRHNDGFGRNQLFSSTFSNFFTLFIFPHLSLETDTRSRGLFSRFSFPQQILIFRFERFSYRSNQLKLVQEWYSFASQKKGK